LEADANLEASWAPVDELDGAFSLQGCYSAVDILGNNIATVQQASSHVLAIARIALNHLVVRLKAGHGDLLDGVRLVLSLGGGDNRSVGDQGEVNTRVGDQVGLELVKVDVERTIETKGSCDGRDDCESC